jgi:alpha-galactosidase
VLVLNRSWLLGYVLAGLCFAAGAQTSAPIVDVPALAPTPPLGWNSWDSYGLSITEAEFKSNVEWFHQHLEPYGWQYVVVDEGWYLAHPENAETKGADQGYTLSPDGRYLPAVNRFPSSANDQGFKTLADYAHSLGLKFGIHIIRGIPKEAVDKNLPIADSPYHAADAADRSDLCRWNSDNYGLKNNAAGQAYYNSIARLYAGWGIDFVKVDCISKPYQADEIHMMSAALKKTGRPIVLSLSPGPTPLEDADDVVRHAQLWRISDDMWDVWSKKPGAGDFPQSLTNQFALLARWRPYAAPGHWPDADMLPIGYLGPRPGWGSPRQSRFTPDEARTLLTLWSIARSPLILGANLTRIDAQTESLLTNREVLAVDQHSTDNHPVIETDDTVIWTARLESAHAGSAHIVAAFNLSDQPQKITYTWNKLGLDKQTYRLRDLWQQKNAGSEPSLEVNLPPHGCALYSLQ